MAPALLAFAERFTVGCFVVTFALYASHVRHLSDGETALHDSIFLGPFAVATYPLARAARRGAGPALMTIGGVAYGVIFLTLGRSSGAGLMAALAAAGVSSAMVYGPSLECLARASLPHRSATAMALFHAAGCVGMLLGPAIAGAASAAMRRAGLADGDRYAAGFGMAGIAQLVAMVAGHRSLGALRSRTFRTVLHA